MTSHGYEEIDHIADLALRVWGEDFTWLLRQSARGLYQLMGVSLNKDIPIEHAFDIVKETKETALVDFLSELLYLAEDEKLGFETFSFTSVNDKLTVHAVGYQVERVERNIKAVTFHNLDIHKTDAGLETIITFDV